MRNSNTLKVLLFTRDISNNPQKLTIYARITVNGKRAEISLKRYVSVNEWDENKGRLHGLTHKARLLNSYLDEVYAAIMDTHKVLLREEKVITSQAIKARYLGQDEQHNTLLELIEYHNKTQKSVLRPGTMKNYVDTPKIRAVSLIIKFTEYDTKKVYPEVQDQGGPGSPERAA